MAATLTVVIDSLSGSGPRDRAAWLRRPVRAAARDYTCYTCWPGRVRPAEEPAAAAFV
jgi:hypothetical protein